MSKKRQRQISTRSFAWSWRRWVPGHSLPLLGKSLNLAVAPCEKEGLVIGPSLEVHVVLNYPACTEKDSELAEVLVGSFWGPEKVPCSQKPSRLPQGEQRHRADGCSPRWDVPGWNGTFSGCRPGDRLTQGLEGGQGPRACSTAAAQELAEASGPLAGCRLRSRSTRPL